jgi:shikimate dehydrogenase
LKTVALLGYPLGHSLTPIIYNATFPAMGLEATCVAWPTPPEALGEAVRRLRSPDILGANVTIPHKEAVVPLLDEVDAGAAAIGAVNCIVASDGRLAGHNTDGAGFLRSLREQGFEPSRRAAMVLGAGGAARAIVVALREAGIAALTVAGRSGERTRVAMAGLGVVALGWEEAGFRERCREADLVVNCTPLGTKGSPGENESPPVAGAFRPGALAFDLVYNPPETPFLRAAEAGGARAVSGLGMLLYQGAESIRLWTGRAPPLDTMRAAALTALARRD